MPLPVIDAVKEHIDLEAKIGGYEAANREEQRCDQVYDSVAKLIGAKPREIALCENATFAWQMAFYGLDLNAGDRILTARAEYAANYVAFLQRAAKIGCQIEIIPDQPDGSTDPDALERMLDERVKLIAITQIPTNGGLINPAEQIGKIANRHGITYLLDACQAVGQMPVDVEQLGCDFLSAAGRKFLRGPRGTGFLYVREKWLDILEPPIIDHFGAEWVSQDKYQLRPDARRYESWENSYALRLGLGAAVDYSLAVGLENISARAFGLAAALREELSGMPGVTPRDLGSEKCAIVTFTHEKLQASSIKQIMANEGINISASVPSSTRLDAERRNLPVVLRVSPHYYNTEDEIERFCQVLKHVA
ncbi:MAG: aminotransferase class V-fold PLP-dependent enzyme [Alphaproteobacteria bacterium]|nr:aminotransferase class V-fold PLP-dependent enzyme [Alphaproteobacteria bacterium]